MKKVINIFERNLESNASKEKTLLANLRRQDVIVKKTLEKILT